MSRWGGLPLTVVLTLLLDLGAKRIGVYEALVYTTPPADVRQVPIYTKKRDERVRQVPIYTKEVHIHQSIFQAAKMLANSCESDV